MKKNMLTIIILAVCVVNMVLTGVIVFAVVPTSAKTSKLITQISSVISLELQNSKGEISDSVDPTQIESYMIEKEMTINLAKGNDSSSHYAIIDSVVLSINKESEGYKKLNATLDANQSFVTDIVQDVVAEYSIENANENRDEMKAKILEKIQNHYDSDFIFSVSLTNLRFQ